MSELLKSLPFDNLEKALQKLESQIAALSEGQSKQEAEQLSLALQKEQQKRERVTKILDETIDKVEKLVQASA